MLRHPEFSLDTWEKAPTYLGPGIEELQNEGGVTILDFDRLSMIAETQIQNGSFITSNEGDTSIAPVKIGRIPAAFVFLEPLTDNDFDTHKPTQPEIFVVIDGIIRLSKKDFPSYFHRKLYKGPKTLSEGESIILRPAATQLKAVGLHAKASGLALSIPFTRDPEEFKIIQDIVDSAHSDIPPNRED